MPTYDYECDACKHAFEEFQSITAKHLKKCPNCGKPKLRRLIGTGAGIIFKGSGFYETDYRSDNYSKDAKADKDGGASGDSSKDSKAKDKTDSAKAKSGESKTKSSDSGSAKSASKPAKKSD
ncbi:MAG: FmdB family zinc ribbon protein [Phycisphaerales bacterium JB063]